MTVSIATGREPLLGDLDLHLIGEGAHRDLSRALGARFMHLPSGEAGVRFAVWAPNANSVSVVGAFNAWDGRQNPMKRRDGSGVWEAFVPGLLPGALYKYELHDRHGHLLPLKADPVALECEPPPATASKVADPTPFRWTDDKWIEHRAARQGRDAPMSIYEVHAGSWLAECRSWDRMADRLVEYVVGMGFTHVEFLPVMEHPFTGSWGYQPLAQFAPTARFGPPDRFAALVDRFHARGVGVLLDWVPAHFPNDSHGLVRFDGTALYEHEDPREGLHRDWNTLIYNFGRHEVRGFLIASALHWLEHFHADGLRVDAVASMLYRNYSRPHGEWVPNRFGGVENLEAVDFLRQLSGTVAQRCPGAILVAEESTAWPGVSAPVEDGGLGFSYKWNMGWMHDTLHYVSREAVHRQWHHHEMTFGLVYAFSEHFVLPLSHDEVVHGKRSLIGRMTGDAWQKMAALRAYFGFMWAHPGKKLLFMGGEFAQVREWDHDGELEWNLLDDPRHRGVQRLVRDLNGIYRGQDALHARDAEPDGFRWIVGDDAAQSVLAFLRIGKEGPPVLAVCNFTPVPRTAYRIGLPHPGRWQELLNTDSTLYGGSNIGNGGGVDAIEQESHGQPASASITLPPLATIYLQAAQW